MHPLILIPARYASTRFPGKPLAELAGKPMIRHVAERASEAYPDVYVATDDERILRAVQAFGGKAVMTAASHASGTDRCFEAYRSVAAETGASYDVVVNVQGDEPFVRPEQIRSLVNCFARPEIQIATLAARITRQEDITDPNKVKVVFSEQGRALYFSRSPIPCCRGAEISDWLERADYYKHIGMYAYRPEVLREITSLPCGKLEKAESLEQLRWLEHHYAIAVELTGYESIGIDTPADLEEARKWS
ncbi:MAG: 3-deoxy-manno-octulosonate cytidylyltransferase [Culturomica sp.]|jgi:3-deoxy-manno-octulosonate cytidylyltransferase (CMP-KDO synthetase)|nr:3-deoxy-manno-octulosonate cytidylyltransferase [Culturomica sp.]